MLQDPGIVELLSAVEPGKIVMVAGRPGAGVSTTLAAVVARCSKEGKPAVMASWERPANALRELFSTDRVEVFDVLGWSVEEFERRLQAAAVPAGTVVAVDYLQLIGGADDTSERLAEVAHETGIAMLLGAMAPRTVHQVFESEAPASLVLRALAGAIGFNTQHVHRLAAILDGGRRRELVISHRAPNLPLVQTTAWLQ